MQKPIHQEIRFPKVIGSEKIAIEQAANMAASVGFSANRIEDIKTAVGEAALNAIEHAHSADRSDTVVVEFDFIQDEIRIVVSSKGQPFVLPAAKPDIKAKIDGDDRPRGWGLFLMNHLADTVEFDSNGHFTSVTMTFRLKNPELEIHNS